MSQTIQEIIEVMNLLEVIVRHPLNVYYEKDNVIHQAAKERQLIEIGSDDLLKLTEAALFNFPYLRMLKER